MLIPVKGYANLILEHYNQIEIFSDYLNISSRIIEHSIFHKTKISNPLRVDNHPSLTFYIKNDKVRMWDYGNVYWRGDIFEIVGKLINRDCKNAEDFIIICKDIITNIEIQESICSTRHIEIIKSIKSKYKRIKNRKIITYVKRKWNKLDINFWKQYGVSISVLEEEHIYPVYTVNMNGYMYYEYNAYDLCYAFDYKKYVKLFFPFRQKKDRYRTNLKYIFENINGFRFNKILVLIKSSKERVVLRSILKTNFPIINNETDIVSFSSESINISNEQIRYLKTKYPSIIVNVDRDATGIKLAKVFKNNKVSTLFIPKYNKNYNIKDLSDVVLRLGINEGINIIKKSIKWLN